MVLNCTQSLAHKWGCPKRSRCYAVDLLPSHASFPQSCCFSRCKQLWLLWSLFLQYLNHIAEILLRFLFMNNSQQCFSFVLLEKRNLSLMSDLTWLYDFRPNNDSCLTEQPDTVIGRPNGWTSYYFQSTGYFVFSQILWCQDSPCVLVWPNPVTSVSFIPIRTNTLHLWNVLQ